MLFILSSVWGCSLYLSMSTGDTFSNARTHSRNLMPILAWRKAFWKDFQLTGFERGVWRAQYPHSYNDVCAHQKIMTEYWVIYACVCAAEAALYSLAHHGCASVKSPLCCALWLSAAVRLACERGAGERERERAFHSFPIMHHFSVWCERDQQQRARNLFLCALCIKNVGAASIHLFLLMSAPRESASTDFPSLCAVPHDVRNGVWIGDKNVPHLLTIGMRGWCPSIDFPSCIKAPISVLWGFAESLKTHTHIRSLQRRGL